MFKINLFLLCIYNSLVNADKLLMIQELFRHGTRETLYTEYNGINYKNDFGELTPVGIRQHYMLGLKLREEYILGYNLISSSYNHSLIKVRSTDVNRY